MDVIIEPSAGDDGTSSAIASHDPLCVAADAIVLWLNPRRVLDIGGALARRLLDRGVHACAGSIADATPDGYDLVIWLAVHEDMPVDQPRPALQALASAARHVLFAPSPTDRRSIGDWLDQFAGLGLAPVIDFDASVIAPNAMLLQRSEAEPDQTNRSAFVEILSRRAEQAALRREVDQLRQDVAAAARAEQRTRQQLERRTAALHHLQAEVQSAAETRHLQEAARRDREATERLALAARLQRLEHSTPWRIARKLSRLGRHIPGLNRAVDYAWWACTGQLSVHLHEQRENRKAAVAVLQTGLFDAAWYAAQNPDIADPPIDPALHYARYGWRERRAPSPAFDPIFYRSQNPDVPAEIDPLMHYVQYGRAEGRPPLPPVIDSPSSPSPLNLPTSRSLISGRCLPWAPLPICADPSAPPTLTILTDGVDPRHLFGGVGTALVIGALIAARMGGRLRLVTRRTAPDAAAIGEILAAHAIDWSGPTDIAHMPLGDTTPLPVGAQDRVLATSWWTARAALGSLPPDRILYLLQEDERLFYANGDERLCCTETLCAPELRALVNSELLFRHLADGPDALPGLRHRARWFNPAFPAFGAPHALSARAGRKNFFFYARPTNARNLYWRGLEVIDAALRRHILHPDEWNIHFVGADLVEMDLPGNLRPTLWSGLPWLQYAELVSRMDLGLCLMDTPHPSYPPLDLSAAGAVVVTNTSGPKTTLAGWSGNILAAPPTLDGLVEALRQAVELAQNLKLRSANWAADSIPRAWEPQLAPALDWLLPAGD